MQFTFHNQLNFLYDTFESRYGGLWIKLLFKLIKKIHVEFFERAERHFMVFFCDLKYDKRTMHLKNLKFDSEKYKIFVSYLKGISYSMFGNNTWTSDVSSNLIENVFKVPSKDIKTIF